MKIKNLALATAALIGLVGAPATFACSIAAWNGTAGGTPAAGRPTDATPVARYSGQCGLRAAATGTFVADNTPTAEPAFRARFYVYTGLTAGSALVYQAQNAGGTQMIGVTYDRAGNQFTFNTSGGSANIGSIVQDRWYSIELNWNRAAPGTMAVSLSGAGSDTVQTANVSGVAAGDQIDTARLGWISGAGTASTRSITADAYESRRNTQIGRLCRGNANLNAVGGNQVRNIFDVTTVISEINGTLGAGQPDCTENGAVDIFDVTCVVGIINSATPTCPAT